MTQGCGAHALETGSDLCGRGTVGPGLAERTVGPPTCDAALHSTVDSIRSLEEGPTSPGTELQWGGSSLDSTLAPNIPRPHSAWIGANRSPRRCVMTLNYWKF